MGSLTVKESGEMINFISPNVSNITSFKVHFNPKQEGSGDPSPENVREIVGWNGVEGYISNVAQSYSSTSNTLTTSIDWTEDVGTVYGGYVDLISGELVEEYAYKRVDANLGVINYATSRIRYTVEDMYLINSDDSYSDSTYTCNMFPKTKASSVAGIRFTRNNENTTAFILFQGIDSFGIENTLEAWNDFTSANDIYITYRLATPITYQLSPQQLSTLKGQNNFWSNADYVEIEYELTETFDIQKAKRKIILNQPHVESASGDLVTFDTDMKGKLKECKVYFSPVQEGEGDPSPENVRNIVGWNGVRVGLPSEYQEVEWIQSTERKQFILLPYGFEETDTVTITASIDTEYTRDRFIIAPATWNNNNNRFAMVGVYGGVYCIGYGNYTTNYTRLEPMTNNNGNMHTWTFANKIFEITDLGLSIDVSNITFGGITSNLKLFYGYNSNINGKLSYYKHVKLNGEVYEFIPCYRKSDGEIGLYDIKNHVFYTNDGTGSFLKGKDVNNITTNINWTDDVGTVYGGYVDLISGELVVNRCFLENKNWTEYKRNNGFVAYRLDTMPMPKDKNQICKPISNIISIFTNFLSDNMTKNVMQITGTTLYVALAEGIDASEIQLSYELAEPIHYQLTPQQILTLKGTNNVYSDANGQTEIKYWKH